MSHDLRTPLASIKASATSLLQDDVDWTPEARHEFLATIDEEADRLNVLVGNLLDMSRLESGVLEVALRPVALEEVVARALASLSRAVGPARRAGVRAAAAGAWPIPACSSGSSPTWCPTRSATRPTTTRCASRPARSATTSHLRIIDQGPGVRPADRDRIFEPFQRLGDRATGTGVGLGLAVARGFTDAMDGELSIEDTPGGGLTTVIALRTAPDAPSTPPTLSADPSVAPVAGSGAGAR